VIRPVLGGRRLAAGRVAAWPARASASAILAAVLAGCGAAAAAPRALVPPSPSVSTSSITPHGKPSRVTLPDQGCEPHVPPMSPMPAPGRMPAGTTMAEIQQRGYLIAGVDQDSYDWGSANPAPDRGQPNPELLPPGEAYVGFDIDILHALARAIFGNADRIRFVPVTQEFRMGAAHDGVVDVVADSITINCIRARQVRFSDNYFNAGEALLVQGGNKTAGVRLTPGEPPEVTGLTGQKVCTVNTTTSVATLATLAGPDGFRLVATGNWSDCLVLLEQGAVQAISTDNTILGGLQAEDPSLKLVGPLFSLEPHGLAFPRSDLDSPTNAEFIGFANGVLRSLGAGVGWCPEPRPKPGLSCWAALYDKWVAPQLGAAVPSPPAIVASGERG
jgi:polar amino acid transport system substrate-binding protein